MRTTHTPWVRRWFGGLALTALLSSGCLTRGPTQTTNFKPATVNVAGNRLGSQDARQPSLSAGELTGKVAALLSSNRENDARRLVQRHPDAALEALRATTQAQATLPPWLFIAQVHDDQCLAGNAQGWSNLLKDRAAQPKRYAGWDDSRAKFVQLMRQGKHDEAVALKLHRYAPHPRLEIDGLRLQAEAYQTLDKPGSAGEMLQKAMHIAGAADEYQRACLLLELAEADRRAGKGDQAAATWQSAVMAGSALLNASSPIIDPGWWEQAASLRIVPVAWPNDCEKAIASSSGIVTVSASVGSEGVEARLWQSIGQWRLNRHETQAALVAFKRAETMTRDPETQARIQLASAAALLALEQRPAAISVLAKLGASETSAAPSALGLLGGIKLEEGSAQQAFAMLKRAVEMGGEHEWHGRAEAEANLGLCYLIFGDENSGLRMLHAAQQRFEAAGQTAMLNLSLENEAAYFDKTSNRERAKICRQRMRP
jgi:hypothetical protein